MIAEVSMFVVVQEVWSQVSPDYETVQRLRTLIVSPETTVGEIMEWSARCNVVGKGDVVLTNPDGNA
jgi:hypothetical protein